MLMGFFVLKSSTVKFSTMSLVDVRRGSAIIELVIVLPVLLGFLSLIVDYGWALYEEAIVLDALRSGARNAVTLHPNFIPKPNCCAITSAAEDISRIYLAQANLQANVRLHAVLSDLDPNRTVVPDQSAMVSVNATWTPRCFLCVLPGIRQLSRTSHFRVEPPFDQWFNFTTGCYNDPCTPP